MNMSTLQDNARAKRRIVAALVLVIVLGSVFIGTVGYGLYRFVSSAGFVKMADQQFGDQHLKTAVALIELHKLRTGRYPKDLSELRYVGQWDMLAIQSVRYAAASDGSSYFVEVKRGWIGKPALNMPADFWHGTGYNSALGRDDEHAPNPAPQSTTSSDTTSAAPSADAAEAKRQEERQR